MKNEISNMLVSALEFVRTSIVGRLISRLTDDHLILGFVLFWGIIIAGAVVIGTIRE